jgi:UDP-glucose 4-epimerase
MKFLIIGGNGFIGSHLVDFLISNNHKVIVYDIAQEKYRPPLKNVDYRINSINDLISLHDAMLDIDIVFHLASSSVPGTSNLDIISDVNENIISSLNILNTAILSKVKKIIYFSSGGAIYSPSINPIKEISAQFPISSYGITKCAIENYFLLYSRLYNIETLIFRPSNPFGPRQMNFNQQGVISTFLKNIYLNEPITVFGDGNSIKDYIYIDDLIKMVYNITISGFCGIFNVGSGIGTSLNDLINKIRIITGFQPTVIYANKKSYDVSNFILDIEKAKGLLGNFEFSNLNYGINETWNWLKNEMINSKNLNDDH